MTLQCDIALGIDMSDKAVMYMSGGKMRAEMAYAQADGSISRASLINDNRYIYTWTDDTPGEGLREKASPSWRVFKTATETYNVGGRISYKCRPWKRDVTKFVPPDGRVFSDVTTITNPPK